MSEVERRESNSGFLFTVKLNIRISLQVVPEESQDLECVRGLHQVDAVAGHAGQGQAGQQRFVGRSKSVKLSSQGVVEERVGNGVVEE